MGAGVYIVAYVCVCVREIEYARVCVYVCGCVVMRG